VPPNADTWAAGDRRMICYLYGGEGIELTSSAAGVDE
jgi:hypothetical protein